MFDDDVSFNEYQVLVAEMPLYDDPLIGIMGEAGEVAELVKKDRRPGDRRREIDKDELTKELGDILWYVTRLAHQYDISLQYIANENIKKLTARHNN